MTTKTVTNHLHPKLRFQLLLVLMCICVFAGGCEHNPVTVWSAETKSPDGNWMAMARSEQWSGPGNNFDATSVYLKQAHGSQSPVEILAFEHDSTHMDLKMTWISPTHLDVAYGSSAKVDFQAVKAFGQIEITLRNLSDGAANFSR